MCYNETQQNAVNVGMPPIRLVHPCRRESAFVPILRHPAMSIRRLVLAANNGVQSVNVGLSSFVPVEWMCEVELPLTIFNYIRELTMSYRVRTV